MPSSNDRTPDRHGNYPTGNPVGSPGPSNDPNRWAQKLADQARILGEARMLRDEQELTDELTAAVITRLKEYLARAGKSEQWAARSMGEGVSPTTLNQVVNGNYKGDVDGVVRRIDKWLEQQILRENAPKPAGYVKTRVAEMIYGVARWIVEINAIGMVTGPSGCGKTMCAQAVRGDFPGSIFITVTTAGQSKLAVLESLVRAQKITGITLTANGYYNLLVDRLKGSNRLIIVDEAHTLAGRRNDEALHTLRHLHAETDCPMLLVGMTNLQTYIQTGKTRYDPLEQLDSRIKFRLDLSEIAKQVDRNDGPGLFTIEDIRRWLAAQKVKLGGDAERYLQMIANQPGLGGLRTCDGLLRVALKVARGNPITAQTLRDILAEQRGERAVEAFEESVEIRRHAATA